MASGPEHYQEAERLLGIDPDDREHSRALTARAQAHATLALAAATALATADAHSLNDPDCFAWRDVASIARPIGGES